MPFVTRKREEVVLDTVERPEIAFVLPCPGKEDAKVYVVEEPPMVRQVSCRYYFQSGDFKEFWIQKPWSYYLARINEHSSVRLSALFFSAKKLKSQGSKGLCAAPLPNVDYGTDKGLGVCLWFKTDKFGKTPEESAVNVHKYFWTSKYNTGVGYYDKGRPEEIQAKLAGDRNKTYDWSPKSWWRSLELWEELTKKNEEIKWIPVESTISKKTVETLEDAAKWLNDTQDHLYK